MVYKSGISIGTRPHSHTPNIMGTNQEPWMTRNSITYLYDYIINNKMNELKLLEYGCGSSTAYFLSLGLKVSSIEHNKEWIKCVEDKLPKQLICNWTPYLITNSSSGKRRGSDGNYYDNYVNHVNHLNMFDI